jgi:hypothetical protein
LKKAYIVINLLLKLLSPGSKYFISAFNKINIHLYGGGENENYKQHTYMLKTPPFASYALTEGYKQ